MTTFVEDGIQHDFGLFLYTKRKDGIIKSVTKRKIKYGLKQAYLAMKFRLSIEPHFKHKLLIHLHPEVEMSSDAHNYLRTPAYREFITAEAIVTNNKERYEYFQKIGDSNQKKIKSFYSEEEAIEWLNSFPNELQSLEKVHGHIRELELKLDSLDQIIY